MCKSNATWAVDEISTICRLLECCSSPLQEEIFEWLSVQCRMSSRMAANEKRCCSSKKRPLHLQVVYGELRQAVYICGLHLFNHLHRGLMTHVDQAWKPIETPDYAAITVRKSGHKFKFNAFHYTSINCLVRGYTGQCATGPQNAVLPNREPFRQQH